MAANKARVIVIGASMAGLLAARVLADHFGQVTIIERDELPDAPEVRGGVPQGRHIHALLAQGQDIMEALFPGLSDELTSAGSPRIKWGLDTAYLTVGGWTRRDESGLETNIITRPDLEWRVRRRLLARGNIEIICRTDVTRLIAEGNAVVGVEIQPRDSSDAGGVQTLLADLVVDVSGRRSKTPEWLTALGYPVPEETHVNSYIGYATRLYEKPQGDFAWKILFMSGRPADGILRGAGIFEVEGGRWMVTLGGVNKDYPPTDDADFVDYTRGLASPEIYDAIKDATPISPIYGYRVDGSRWRHYEKLTRRPARLLIMGDALCAFNPLYGQGMTVAAMEARDLGALLTERRDHWDGLEAAFQHVAAKSVQRAWLMATGEDLRYPGTEGDRPGAMERLAQRYVDRVVALMPYDIDISRAFINVMNLNDPATVLFAPSILGRVLRGSRNTPLSGWEGAFAPTLMPSVSVEPQAR
ncbi:MAG: 2-polyprenyl-6-methoxyphenol hydroxylase-like oxidoreductase [Chloroflexota bacterium]|nr:2-polyprenyl-6-methoxyphenol hydroxylase-like oxidoreductase [Chloroflexota bacterium]